MKEKEWLEKRKKGISGTDASAILGLNPYKTSIDVWSNKVHGLDVPFTSNLAVEYGLKAEKPLIDLFALDYQEYKVSHKDYDFRVCKEYDFLIGSLDGELIEKSSGEHGVLEVKTTTILNSMHKEKWNNKIPDNYYIQVLHYMIVTGYSFAFLKAQLKSIIDGETYLQTKHYKINREEVIKDIDYLRGKEIEFWNKYVLTKKQPPLALPQI